MKFKPWMIVVAVFLLAIVLRFWQLGNVPVSPDWDEAALGYNAYSILKTGRDEYGVFLPRELRSYDDYKPPLYAYLTIPSIAVFGLNTWAVRLPSAVMGSLAVLGTYFLIYELLRWHEKATKQKRSRAFLYAVLTMLMLAISPWHLQFSRIAFEANTGVTLNIWGAVAFLWGLSSLPWMIGSAFLFGLSLYAYHSERVFVPLLVLTMAVLWRKELFTDAKKVIIAVIVGLIVVAPLIPIVTDKTAMTRLRGTSPLSDQTALLARTVKKLEQDQKNGDTLGELLDNRRIVYVKTLIDGYISHFSFDWLFLSGDNNRHHAPDNGILYLWEMPFVVWGMIELWKRGGRLRTFVFTWFFIAPIAASPTGGTPHAIRTLVFLPTFQFFTAIGLVEGYETIRRLVAKQGIKRFVALAGAVLSGCFIIFFTLFYFHMYYHQMNREYSQDWQYGYQQAVSYAEAHKASYKHIVVSTALEQPHMFFLFFTKYDPATYLAGGGTVSGGFREMHNHFDIYEFRPIHWSSEKHDGSTLYIGTPKDIPGGSLLTIHYLNGQDAIRISQ